MVRHMKVISRAYEDVNNTVPLRVHVLEKLLGGLFSKQEKC